MSARRNLIAALAEDSLGGIATLEDVTRAEQLVDSHRTEVIAKAIGRLRAIPVTCTALTGPVWYGDGWNSAITVLEEIAEYQTPDDEAYPGELQRLRALVLGLRVAALRKGDMARVQWLLTDHEETRKKATATPAATATSQGPVFDPLPSYLHAIGQAGSETEQKLYAAYVQAIAEVTRLQAETGDGQPPAGEATPDFFQPGHTYQHRQWKFLCDAVTTHPDTGTLTAIGWFRFRGERWRVFSTNGAMWADGWTDVTEAGAE